jgi:hypothetical protein
VERERGNCPTLQTQACAGIGQVAQGWADNRAIGGIESEGLRATGSLSDEVHVAGAE